MKAFLRRKEELFHVLLKSIIYFGAIAYIPSIFACLYEELYLLALIDTLGFILFLTIYFYPGIKHDLRIFITVCVTLATGAAVLIETGCYGAGHIWLLSAVFIAALFSKPRIIVTAIVSTQFILLIYGILNTFGMLKHRVPTVSIFAISANMILISVTVSLIAYFLLRSLQEEIENHENLMRLLHHRIKNNLQAFESLIALSSDEIDKESTLPLRARAISAANNLILDAPKNKTVDLAELIRILSDPATVSIEGYGKLSIRAEELNEVAVGLSDLINILTDQRPISIHIGDEIVIRGQGSFLETETRLGQLNHKLIPREWLDIKDDHITLHIPGLKSPQ